MTGDKGSLDPLEDRLSELEAALAETNTRLSHLERLLGQVPAAPPARTPLPAPPPQVTAAPTPRLLFEAEDEPSAGPAVSTAPPRRDFRMPQLTSELEVAIGTSWLNRLGIIAILAAVAYFLKYSFDNDWIGPTGRVGVTLVLGVGLLLAGERYQRRRLPTFA